MSKYINGCCIAKAKELSLDGTNVLIPHIVNDVGVWGSGVVIALSKEWPVTKKFKSPEYHFHENPLFKPNTLGATQFISPELNITVANMYAQTGVGGKPIRYEALVKCMRTIADYCEFMLSEHNEKTVLICPKFGSLRAGGNWDFIEELINEIWCDLKVVICEYTKK